MPCPSSRTPTTTLTTPPLILTSSSQTCCPPPPSATASPPTTATRASVPEACIWQFFPLAQCNFLMQRKSCFNWLASLTLFTQIATLDRSSAPAFNPLSTPRKVSAQQEESPRRRPPTSGPTTSIPFALSHSNNRLIAASSLASLVATGSTSVAATYSSLQWGCSSFSPSSSPFSSRAGWLSMMQPSWGSSSLSVRTCHSLPV